MSLPHLERESPLGGPDRPAGEETHELLQKPPFSSQLHIRCKHCYSLGLIKARTSPGLCSNLSLKFQSRSGWKLFWGWRGKWEELWWGPGSFKTGSSDKEISSLPQCLHPCCILATSNGPFPNRVSKIKPVRFIFLNVSTFPCSFCLEIRSAPCWDPHWNYGDASRWTEFRFAIFTEKQRRENEKRRWSRFSHVISAYSQAFKTGTYQLKVLLIYWATQKLIQLPETEKTPEKFSCGSSTGCWLCSCSAKAQPGELRGSLGIHAFFSSFL